MKKLLLFTLTFVLCLCSALVTAEKIFVTDEAELISATEEAELENIIRNLNCDADIAIVTVYGTDGKTPMEYADDFYDNNGYGEDGVLLLISMEERDWYISTSGECQYIFSDRDIEKIGNAITEYLSDGNYFTAFVRFIYGCESEIESYDGDGYLIPSDDGYDGYYNKKSDSFPFLKWIAISIGLGFTVALISVSVMKGNLKSVRHNSMAQNYIKRNSFRLTQKQDLFLYRHVTRTVRQDDSSSGGGGSHVHMSSSGHSHGGGGGKF